MSYDKDQRRRYNLENQDRLRAWRQQYWKKNKDILNQKRREKNRLIPDAEKKRLNKLNKDKIRNHKLKYKYGISIEDERRMLAVQGNACAICKNGDARLVVDHCHATGKIRGMLCERCNHVIGHAKENTQTLENAIRYLKTHAIQAL